MSLHGHSSRSRFFGCDYGRLARQSIFCAVALMEIAAFPLWSQTQQTAMFDVDNPKNQRWYPAEARKIYTSTCDLVARSIRPDKPPHLEPRFRLVLGTKKNEFIRNGRGNELRLKSWDPEWFAQGVALGAIHDMLANDELARIAHQSVVLADSTVDVRELRGH